MASAAAVATAIIIIIAASIVATVVVSAAHHQHHGNISFQIPSTRHGGHRFRHQYYFGIDDPRRIRPNRNDYSSSRTSLRYHLDVDGNSVGGVTNPANVGRRRWRRNSHYFGSSFDPALQKVRQQRSLSTTSPFQLYHSKHHNTDHDLMNISPRTTLQLQQKIWLFRNKYPISYEVARVTVSQEGDDVDNNNNNSMEDRKLTIVDHKEEEVEEVPILLLNGFGVGSFHQHRLMRQLLLQHAEYEQQQNLHQHSPQQQNKQQQLVIYGIDYLGQGNSWPATCNGDGTSRDELNLGYSADVWLDQLKDFIDEVVLVSPSSSSLSNNDITMAPSSSSCRSNNKKVHLVGNSVGGYLATILTSRHPHYIASLILLNATPVWGLNLPGWDGRLPPPPLPKFVGGELFDIIRNPNVINMYLQTAYVHPEAYDGTYEDCFYGADDGLKQQEDSTTRSRKDSGDASLGVKIRACTEGKGGHVAFASILWSAPASEWEDKKETKKTSTTKEVNDDDESKFATPIRPVDFYSTLQNLPVDVLLLFGANDPWCTPAIAKRMHTTLSKRNDDGGDNRVTTANDDSRHVRIVSLVQRYVSLDNVGHCPNHEAPTAVAKVVLPWIRAGAFSSSSSQDQQQQNRYNVPLVVHDGSELTREPWGVVRACEVSLDESRDLGVIDRIVSSMVG